MKIDYHHEYPVGATCDACGHDFPIDPCTEENLVTLRRTNDNGTTSKYSVAKCPKCGKVNDGDHERDPVQFPEQDESVLAEDEAIVEDVRKAGWASPPQ